MKLQFQNKHNQEIKLEIQSSGSLGCIFAFVGEEKIAHLSLIILEDKIVAHDVLVKKELRRTGIATALYNQAESYFKKEIIPYEYFNEEAISSEEAGEFWRKRGKILYSF